MKEPILQRIGLWWLLNVSEPLFERFHRRRWYRFVTRAWHNYVHEPWYWLKCAVWHQYNVIHVTTLPPTWMDRDTVMLHACFQILTDFVDREHPFDHFDTIRSTNRTDWEEVLRLYAWWTVERPCRPASYGDVTNEDLIAAFLEGRVLKGTEIKKQYNDEDQEMLVRLILVRKMLWT